MNASAHGGAFDGAVIVRLFERLRNGTRVSDVLRDVVRLLSAAHSMPASAFFVLRDANGPVVLISWPGPSVHDPAVLFAEPMFSSEVLADSHVLIAELAKARGFSSGARYMFKVGAGLEGTLVVLTPGDGAQWLSAVQVLGEATAGLVHMWDADRRLRDLAERHRLVSQATQHVIYDWDIPTDTLTWNSRMADVFGHQPDPNHEQISWWRSLLHGDDRERVKESLEKAMRERELFWTCEYRFRRGDSTYAWVFDRGALVYDGDARATRMLGVMEDISRDRELESRLALSSRLAAVGSLASGIAHEINNPLAWVTSNLGFALEELKKLGRQGDNAEACEEIAEALDDSQTGANRIAQIVSDLRTFAHADSDRLSPVSVRRVVEGALTMANNELRHRARVVRKLDDAPMVMANEARLGHAVLNLVLNAAWSAGTPKSAAEVVISTSKGSRGYALIEVADNGVALAPEVLPHLFDPFYSARPGGEGLGLGLAVTHSIVVGFGGSIDVESNAQGTVFRVLLPGVSDEHLPAPREAEQRDVQGRRALVMVIDDEPAILSAILRTLTPTYEVLGFTDARHAIEALQGREPDLILCDVMMPEMSGAEVWARIEADWPKLLPRVVLLTGGAFTRDAEAFIERCPAPVVDKPFTPTSLRDAVGRLVGVPGEPE